jgi:glucose/arabinose dehydrogenase
LPALQQYLVPPIQIARPEPWGDDKPKVPDGFKAQALATGFEHPRSLYVLPNGDILVIESNGPKAPVFRPKDIITGWVQWFAGAKAPDANRITLLRDTNGDGVPEVRTVFLDHLNSPFGVALVDHDLYVANTDAIVRYPYDDGQTTITTPGTKLTDLPGGPIDHHCRWWPVRTAPSSMSGSARTATSQKTESRRNTSGRDMGGDRATGAHRTYASGARNPAGLQWEHETGRLWAIANERDEIGPDLVPDYLTSVQDGGFYGWPYSYYGQHLDPRVEPQRPDLVAKAIAPDYALSSHVAPLGLAMYWGNELGKYRSGAFAGEHGSWDRTPLNGYKVVFSGGKPSGPAEDVVTGFLDANNRTHGRPVGLAIDRTGALLIADDVGNRVWRVSSVHAASASKPPS